MSTSTLILVLMPVLLLQISLQVYALYDLWKSRSMHKNAWMWVLVILLLELLGPLAYFTLGHKGERV